MGIMRSSFDIALVALLLLVVGAATAFPIPFDGPYHLRKGSTSPRLSCAFSNSRSVCWGFEISVVRQNLTPSSSHSQFSTTTIGSGQLVSKGDRQNQRIMDVKEDKTAGSSDNSWLTPDVQVVLWFVLLCCVSEGIVSGFRWWRKSESLSIEREMVREKSSSRDLQKVDEEDYDDEANIPVL